MSGGQQTKQDADDSKLILYRLGVVEGAVKDVSSKLDRQDTIKRADLVDFRDTIINRITDVQTSLQKQIDSLDNEKASSQEFRDFKKQMGALGVFISAIIVALFSYLLTRIH